MSTVDVDEQNRRVVSLQDHMTHLHPPSPPSFSSQTIMRIVVSNVTLVDNGLGIMPLVYAPPALSHAFADKPVHVQVREEAASLRV